ncbi:MAG: hypothetical protein OEY00_06165 [Gammaproteobacteria bacterium]|nr:hypothetical protein [Gammaproteobacteria bacterium]
MNATNPIIGEDSQDIELDSSSVNYDVTLQMLTQASRSVDIFSQKLDSKIYNHRELIEQIKTCVLGSSHSRVRILIANPEALITHRHQIIDLAQRLTSNLEIRHTHADYRGDTQDFLLVDERATIRRPHGDRYEGIANFNNPAMAKELGHYFDEVWNHSSPSPELRRLHL